MKWLCCVCFSFVAASAAYADAEDTAEFQTRAKGMPQDVRVFLKRTIECHQWRSERAYDQSKAKQIRTQIKDLGCGRLAKEARNLSRKYRKKPLIRSAVNNAQRDFK